MHYGSRKNFSESFNFFGGLNGWKWKTCSILCPVTWELLLPRAHSWDSVPSTTLVPALRAGTHCAQYRAYTKMNVPESLPSRIFRSKCLSSYFKGPVCWGEVCCKEQSSFLEPVCGLRHLQIIAVVTKCTWLRVSKELAVTWLFLDGLFQGLGNQNVIFRSPPTPPIISQAW